MEKSGIDVRDLKTLERKRRAWAVLSEEDGWEIVRTRRRGVSWRQISKALGMSVGSHVLTVLGTWAARYVKLPEDK